MDIALQVKRNAQEQRQKAEEMDKWIREMEQRQPEPAVRNAAPIRTRVKQSWDSFDVDKALEDVDYQSVPVHVKERNVEEGLVQKEVGNQYFKKANYKKAILAYTKSFEADPLAVPIVNRAMCYLKLEMYDEAELDCSKALEIDSKNVKAYWRRAKARIALFKFAEAEQDFQRALVLEPTNETIKSELSELKSRTPAAPRRRRLEIKEFSDHVPSAAEPPIPSMDPTVKPAESPYTIVNPAESVDTIAKPAKSVEEFEKATLDTKLQPPQQHLPAKTPPKAQMKPQKKPLAPMQHPIPSTLYDLEREWKSRLANDEELYRYLLSLSTVDFPRIFKNSFDIVYFSKMIQIIYDWGQVDDQKTAILSILQSISQTPRFDMVKMFLSKQDKKCLGSILDWLSAEETLRKKME